MTTYQTEARATQDDSAKVYARVALAFSIVGAAGLGFILALAALSQRNTRDEDRRLAFAAMAISAVWTLVFVLAHAHVI